MAIHNAVNDVYALLVQGKQIKAHINDIMTGHFGSDVNGDWDRRMAYDVCETALTKFVHTYGKLIVAKADGNHSEVFAMLGKIKDLLPGEYVRSDEQIELQQFSTPIDIAYLATIAAQIKPNDVIVEPSAGTGLLGAFAKSYGNKVFVNEIAEFRSGCLKAVYDNVSCVDAKYLADMNKSVRGTVCVMNPPFARDCAGESRNIMTMHIDNALSCLADGGRLVLITGVGFNRANSNYKNWFESLQDKADIIFTSILPNNSFGKHGTSVDTRITVIDKGNLDNTCISSVEVSSLAELANDLDFMLKNRRELSYFAQNDKMCKNRTLNLFAQNVENSKNCANNAQKSQIAVDELSNDNVIDVKYSNELPVFDSETEDNMYHNYQPQVLNISGAKLHPSKLVQSMAMSSVAPPPCRYIPKTYANVVENGLLSNAQLETLIYAGEQHSKFMTGKRVVSEDSISVSLSNDNECGVSFRKGYFLGDGTGCGKGRQVAGIILDNMLQGRKKALWVSKSDKLYEDAIRDWTALGGKQSQVFSQCKFKRSATINVNEGILFTTYSTLRSGATQTQKSRLQQILDWLGDDFDGVIIFDEAHAMSNAAGSVSERGVKKASAQGIAGLKLQNLLPSARIVYVSATGASDVNNLAYADRLGLWANNEFPYENRQQFVAEMKAGGVAAMEVISRDLKALGLYTARSLSYDGVEVDILTHNLTDVQIGIYDSYAKAYKQIHNNLELALESTNITLAGASANKRALATAKGAFESNKQRFFASLLTAMKCPTMFNAINNDLANDKAVVIQVVSTGGAMLERRLMEIPKANWNDLEIDLTPREYILDYLENSFPTALYKVYIDDNGEERSEIVYDDNGNPIINMEADKLRNDMLEMVCALPPVESALDQIIKHYGADKVAEVTGRNRRIIINDDGKVCVQNRTPSANINETNDFMNGNKDILIFSDAGGTGRSYHADLNCNNQKQRIHYLLEAGWRADNAVQGLGRTNRTNQANAPVFRPVTTDVKGEHRFISTIAKRLDGLGAITKGQRDTGGQGMFKSEDNLETDYARQAMRWLLRDIYMGKADISKLEFEDITALQLSDSSGTLKETLPPITQVLNRILALPIKMQNDLFDIFNKYLNGTIENTKANGSYDEGVKLVKAKSLKVVDSTEIYSYNDNNKTYALTIKRTDDVVFNEWEKIVEKYDNSKFVFNTSSENVAIRTTASHITTDTGEVRRRYALHRISTVDYINVNEFEKSNWKEISKERFIELWDSQKANEPTTVSRQFKMITGVLLPIWKVLPNEQMEIKRLKCDNGNVILGRIIAQDKIDGIYAKLKVNKPNEIIDINSIYGNVLNGETVDIDENIKIKSSLVNGSKRYEVIGCNYILISKLKSLGCFTEIIQYKTRLFIPEPQLKSIIKFFTP